MHYQGLNRDRKRLFFKLCASIIIAAFIVLSVIDFLEGDILENEINIAVILILSVSLVFLKFSDAVTAVYRSTHFLICMAFFYSVAIGSGEGTVLYWVFIMPLLFFFFFGKWEGLIWGIVFSAGIMVIMIMPNMFNGYLYGQVVISRFFITFSIITLISFGLESSRHAYHKLLDEKNQALTREKDELEKAVQKIKTLSGLIPICSNCKKVRKDDGYWEQVEIYIQQHSNANFTHGLCPDCLKSLYPDFDPNDPE